MSHQSETIVRAISFPIVGPNNGTWDELRPVLHACWARSTALANWAMTELVKVEKLRHSDDKKFGQSPKLYLYGHAKKNFWDWAAWEGSYQTANCILRTVEKKWRKARYQVIWTGREAVPLYRYPMPYPVHNQSWTASFDEGNCPTVKVTLNGKVWELRLRGGPEFVRQLIGFRQISEGAVKKGELAVYRKGRDRHIIMKLIAHFPKPLIREGHTLLVRTDPNCFWICEREGRAPWIVNVDHIKRWIVAHQNFLQRINEDTKFEKRWPAKMRENINKVREVRCQKQHDRLDTWMHQATAMLTQFAVRQGASEILYDDECQEYLPSFPWHQLKTKLGYKLESAGITLTAADSSRK